MLSIEIWGLQPPLQKKKLHLHKQIYVGSQNNSNICSAYKRNKTKGGFFFPLQLGRLPDLFLTEKDAISLQTDLFNSKVVKCHC